MHRGIHLFASIQLAVENLQWPVYHKDTMGMSTWTKENIDRISVYIEGYESFTIAVRGAYHSSIHDLESTLQIYVYHR